MEIDILRQVILERTGCSTGHVSTVPVNETFQAKTVWQVEVQVFDVIHNPKVSRCYARAYQDEDGKTQYMVVLGLPPVESAQDAVKAAMSGRVNNYPANMDSANLDPRLDAFRRSKECREALDDPIKLQAEILNFTLKSFPANRAALLLNGEHASPDPEDFKSSMYGKRAGEPKRFRVPEKALEFVYTYREAYMSDDAMCAPLMLDNWTIIGVIYLDTRKPDGFEVEEVELLQKIAVFAAKLISRSLKQQAEREEMDSYHEHLEVDDFEEGI
jgi:hypothetical protein